MQETPVSGSERSCGEVIGYPLQYPWTSLVAQIVKNVPAMWETWVRSLSWKDPRQQLTAPVFWPGEFDGQRSLTGATVHGVTKSRT